MLTKAAGVVDIGDWLLAIGYWLLVIGYWRLAIGDRKGIEKDEDTLVFFIYSFF